MAHETQLCRSTTPVSPLLSFIKLNKSFSCRRELNSDTDKSSARNKNIPHFGGLNIRPGMKLNLLGKPEY